MTLARRSDEVGALSDPAKEKQAILAYTLARSAVCFAVERKDEIKFQAAQMREQF